MIRKLLARFKRKHLYRYRDAITGAFVSKEYAVDHPETTIRETVW